MSMKVSTFYLCFIITLLIPHTTALGSPCPFNSDCQCELASTVECANFSIFPSFTYDNETYIRAITISGNFSYIPPKAFYNLTGMNNAYVTIAGPSNGLYSSTPMEIDDNAFVTLSTAKYYLVISHLEFDNVYMNSIPTIALSNLTLNGFYFDSGTLNSIGPSAFQGLTSTDVEVTYSKLMNIDPAAFDGLQFKDSGLLTSPILQLWFSYNFLTEISPAFKTTNASEIYLQNNQITYIPDYAFCNNTNGCNNLLESVNLSSNSIYTIADNAFLNLPKLLTINLSNNNLTAIPANAFKNLPTVDSLNLGKNQITKVEANSFYGSRNMVVYLEFNPITLIEPGAFNGNEDIDELRIFYLYDLTFMDVLVTYGMRLQVLHIKHCPALSNLTLSDYSKIPSRLFLIKFDVGTNVRYIDQELQNWFDVSIKNTMTLSPKSTDFDCNPSIAWMAKYALCTPTQILITEHVICAITNQKLLDYLSTFNPSC